MECIGYITASNSNSINVVLPEKPFGKLNIKLPQKEKLVNADCYDCYELKGFKIEIDEKGDVVDWKFKNVLKCVDVKYFVALFADGRVLADDGKIYKLWDSTKLSSKEYLSHFDWMFSSGTFNSSRNIRLFIKGDIIYGTEESVDYRFRRSWDIEDILAKCINGYDRYLVKNLSEKE